MKLIESVVDLIELGAIQPQDIVKNLRSALAQTKPLSDEEIEVFIQDEFVKFQSAGMVSEEAWEIWLCRAIEAKVRGQ